MKLLFISHKMARYGTLEGIRMVLDGGCRHIQLRMKDTPEVEVQRAAAEAVAMCRDFGAAIYIDDFPHVCRAVGAAGVHLGKMDMSPVEARQIVGSQAIIGGTANTFEDIAALAGQGVDYIGLGPFRFTETKKNLSPVLGLAGYQAVMKACRDHGIALPVVAIGGITAADIPAILATGVSGIALSSTILAASDPTAETRKLIKIINNEKSENCGA